MQCQFDSQRIAKENLRFRNIDDRLSSYPSNMGGIFQHLTIANSLVCKLNNSLNTFNLQPLGGMAGKL